MVSVDVGGQCGHRMLSGDIGKSVGQGAVKRRTDPGARGVVRVGEGEEGAMGPDLLVHQRHGYRVTLESTLQRPVVL